MLSANRKFNPSSGGGRTLGMVGGAVGDGAVASGGRRRIGDRLSWRPQFGGLMAFTVPLAGADGGSHSDGADYRQAPCSIPSGQALDLSIDLDARLPSGAQA
jgi:hypothetical protein